MNIPLVDLARQHREIAAEVEAGLAKVFAESSFIKGREVEAFEETYADFCGTEHCIGVGNGTDAIELSVRALGIGPGDEVIVPANSFIATALGPLRAGAQVILVDCHPDTSLVDTDHVSRAITARTKAVIPVHLYGQMASVTDLVSIAGSVPIIEDAAQSQGADQNGIRSGSAGLVAATSFYPGKNLGAYGDAGAVTTNDSHIAERVRSLGNWGSDRKYHHPIAGFNSRLDTVQAVVLSAKLRRLEAWNAQRKEAARRYDELLADLPQVARPVVASGNSHVWHLYVVRIPNRDRVLAQLHEAGVGAGIHYPIPMHLQGALSDLGYRAGSFPVAEQLASEVLSLPLFPGISETEQEYVTDRLGRALSSV